MDSLNLPFTKEQFFDVMLEYHRATWPAVLVFSILAIAAVSFLYFKYSSVSRKMALAFLGLLWAWMGVMYHWKFFRPINPAATFFAVLFLAQSVLCFWHALRLPIAPDNLFPRAFPKWTDYLGLFFVVFSLFLYPLLGLAFGHSYPRGPIFPLPCPSTIFTFATLIFLKLRPKTTVALFMIPIIWSGIGTFAAISLAVYADWVLGISGLLATVLCLRLIIRD